MAERLIVVSNRVPTDGPPSGGLVVALHECLKEQGGLWIGTSGNLVDRPGEFHAIEGDGYDIRAFDLTAEEHAGYYLSYANSVLWPLCHRRADLLDLDPAAFDIYMQVNDRLADLMVPLLRDDDLVWIHDYHFMPLAACLRARGVRATLGYFHHIPFPTAHDLGALPQRDQLPGWMAAFDLVGLQTQNDVSTALAVFRSLDRTELLSDGSLFHKDRRFELHSFPIGIDAQAFQDEAAQHDGRALLNLGPDERLVIGVDRLDYSKGLGNRFGAFGQYLEDREPDDPRASLLQIAPPTREAVQAYQEVRAELEQIAGRTNGLYSDLGWTPIRYIHRAIARDTLASLYRAADVGLVTPLADGMNLVAKEYVAAQDPDDPGVLILSAFAGAAEQMDAALIVNPYDLGQMAQAIKEALTMSQPDRIARHRDLMQGVRGYDIGMWTHRYLDTLRHVPERNAAMLDRLARFSA